ncbi:Aerobic respiration control sensor protein ArcB, partial [Haemophilus influenzae]
AAIFC